MFQYAFGRRLAIERGVELACDCALLHDHSDGRHDQNRHLALDVFSMPLRMAQLADTYRVSAWAAPRLLRPAMRALGLADESRQIAETRFGFDPVAAARVGDDAYLSGLWQSYRYFETIELELRQDFQFAVPLGGAAAALARDIDHSMSVCVHVRRTDFLRQGPKSPIAFVGTGYYRRGAERILDEYPSARFFVFSDDIDWCRQHLDFIPNPIFVTRISLVTRTVLTCSS